MRHYVAINQINHSSIVKCYHTSNMYHTFLFLSEYQCQSFNTIGFLHRIFDMLAYTKISFAFEF